MKKQSKKNRNDFIKNNPYIGESFDDYLKEKLKDEEYRILFEEKKFLREISNAVVSMRKAHGLTQEEIAKKTGIKQSVIARFESAKNTRIPSFQFLKRILEVFGRGVELNFPVLN